MTRRKKNPYAVELARKAARARLKKIPPEERRRIARNAALARWKTRRPAAER